MSDWHLRQAVRVVRRGGVIAYPTESVFGLGCLPWRAEAVGRIISLKRRPREKGMIIVGAGLEDIAFLARIPAATEKEILGTWPGPVTWVLPAAAGVPDWLTGGGGRVAVRVSAHPVVRELCRALGPLVSTSANPAGLGPARSRQRVRAYFGAGVDYIVPGALGSAPRPTEIRDGVTGAVLRKGA